MNPLRYTLTGDGSSDRCLTQVINWILSQFVPLAERGILPQVADLGRAYNRPRRLSERVETAYSQCPCDLLFVHRDAETQAREQRVAEVREAADWAGIPCYVPVVPVRMTEAWLLIDEQAIRTAADNPNGTVPLQFPPARQLEQLADPKERLHQCLRLASEKKGRRLQQFGRDLPQRVQRVADLIEDFSPLRQLDAFLSFEAATLDALRTLDTLL